MSCPTSYLHFKKLQEGKEKGLEYYYRRYFRMICYRLCYSLKNDLAASSITQEAFLRLWIFRQTIKEEDDVLPFLWRQVKRNCHEWNKRSDLRFFNGLVRLDSIENYQEFMAGYTEGEPDDTEKRVFEDDGLSGEQQEQWEKLQAYIPTLDKEQQAFLQLCLRYSFCYSEIARCLGGISGYAAGLRVEKLLSELKNALTAGSRLDQCRATGEFKYEGELNEEQAQILKMRYELQYSFEEIAGELNLPQGYVQKAFVQARIALKRESH